MRNLGIGTALGFGLLTVPAMAQDQFLPGPGSTSQTIIVTGVRDGYQIDATSTATRTPTELNDVPKRYRSSRKRRSTTRRCALLPMYYAMSPAP